MKSMNEIFKMNQENFNIKDIQKTAMQFQMQMEKQDLIAEQMNEAMDMDGDEDELDEEAEKVIQDLEFKSGGGGNKQTV